MYFYLGEKIKELRISKKLTQDQLARRLDLATSSISSYEVCNRHPSYDVLVRMARLFNVSTDYLLGIPSKDVIDVTGLNANQLNIIRQIITEFKNNSDGE